MTSIRAITNSTELCPVNSVLIVTKHYECRGVYHSFNKLFAIKVYSLFVCLCDTHTSHSLKYLLLNLHYHVVPLYTPMICVMFHLQLQYLLYAVCLSTLKQEIYFKQLTGFIFYIAQQKGMFLAVSEIRNTFTTTQNTKLLHILCMSDNYYLPLALL